VARKPPARPSLDPSRRQAAPAVPSVDRPVETRLAGARDVPLDRVRPDPAQPRRDWEHADGEARLIALTASVREFGILQPLLVRQAGGDAGSVGRAGDELAYTIIAGGRRYEAARRAGLATVPVVVRDDPSERVRVLQLLENLQRQDLPPLDEARAYQELLDGDQYPTAQALAVGLHISGQHVRDRLRLLADQVFADAVERRQISATAARDIMTLPDDELERFRRRVLAGERLQSNDVAEARARLAAAGVANPRRKGTGRSQTPADSSRKEQPLTSGVEAVTELTAHPPDMASVDTAQPRVPSHERHQDHTTYDPGHPQTASTDHTSYDPALVAGSDVAPDKRGAETMVRPSNDEHAHEGDAPDRFAGYQQVSIPRKVWTDLTNLARWHNRDPQSLLTDVLTSGMRVVEGRLREENSGSATP